MASIIKELDGKRKAANTMETKAYKIFWRRKLIGIVINCDKDEILIDGIRNMNAEIDIKEVESLPLEQK